MSMDPKLDHEDWFEQVLIILTHVSSSHNPKAFISLYSTLYPKKTFVDIKYTGGQFAFSGLLQP